MSRDRQAAVGLLLAAGIIATWAALHIWSVFFLPLGGPALWGAPLLVALLCWLNVGLFIVAHDAMHGSLVPGRPAANLWAGRLALALYAGFWFDRLLPRHHAHHRHSGTADDPDFDAGHPTSFWHWYRLFFRRYFGSREFMILSALLILYRILGAAWPNLLLFWALPAVLSSLQLFLFGTYLPHRHHDEAFADDHRARSSGYPSLLSLLTCFHFGYHHEHHRSPSTPWWKLPQERFRGASPR